jgi:hypothetical protein
MFRTMLMWVLLTGLVLGATVQASETPPVPGTPARASSHDVPAVGWDEEPPLSSSGSPEPLPKEAFQNLLPDR